MVADVADMAFRAITATVKGGSALERHLRSIEKSLGQGAHVRVGFLGSATYPAGKDVGKQVAQVAAWNEFGTIAPDANEENNQGETPKGIPERPFIRTMVAKKSPRWGQQLGVALKKSNYDAMKGLAIMGEIMQGQMRDSIENWTNPPNADATVKRKGFNKPLIDTGFMKTSVDYQVLDGENSSDDD